MPELSAWPYPRLIAHRGGGRCAPENTLGAMREGFDRGYRMVEFDVKLSRDGVLVLMHDDTVERTCNGTGVVAAMDYAQLAQLDAGYATRAALPRFVGEPVPTLAAVLAFCAANGVAVSIEIKPNPGEAASTGAAAAACARAWASHFALPPLLSSFEAEAIAAAQRTAPDLPRAHLFAREKLAADWLVRLARYECAALDTHHTDLSPQIVANAHAAGYRVRCYTVNEAERMRELIAWGVDSLFTDAIDTIAPQ
jgi:glycerophosphoryl diester phosphodiesterase